jgi:hypothetical protein
LASVELGTSWRSAAVMNLARDGIVTRVAR